MRKITRIVACSLLTAALIKCTATVWAEEAKWEPIRAVNAQLPLGPEEQPVVPAADPSAPALPLAPLPALPPSSAEAIPAPRSSDATADLERRLREIESRLNTVAAPAPKADGTPKSGQPSTAEKMLRQCDPPAKKPPKMEASWKNALWFESADKNFRFNVGGVIQYDMTFYNADDSLVQSIGIFNNFIDPGQALQDGFSFRRARLRFAGTLYEQFEFYAQYEFAQAFDLRRRTLGIQPASATPIGTDFDPGDNVGFNEVWVGYNKLPLIGEVRVGRSRESLNFVTATSDTNQIWMERGLMFDAFNGDWNFSNGILVQNRYYDDRIYYAFGWFHSNNNTNRGFFAVGDGDFAYDGRVTSLVVDDEAHKTWVHVGANYSYRIPYQNQTRYRDRPLIRSGPAYLAPNILNTGNIFTTGGQQIANLEFAMAAGRFTFATEWTTSWLQDAYPARLPRPDDPASSRIAGQRGYQAGGGYVEALCFLTDDHRPYRKERPGYDRVVPNDTFYCLNGEKGSRFGCGAWEVGIRYDYVDLTNNGINGGIGYAVTACLNWYLNPNARVQMNYSWFDRQFAPSDTLGRVEGPIHAFGMRFNSDF